MDILTYYTTSNEKVFNYKSLGLVELYNFDIILIFI
jgi:hypothetical protein